MPSTATKVGHVLAKGLGIKLQERQPYNDEVTRGESVFSVQTADTFVEEPPHTLDLVHELIPTGHDVGQYLYSLFPFIHWIGRYNLQWFLGDLVAGITIGAVVVPQGMAYAGLANLEPQYGLYSSFMGVLLYWFFATSKDITIGPVAVMSTVTGSVVTDIMKELPGTRPETIASALAILAGSIVLFIGLIRCGWIVDLIPLVSLSAFMTGSALSIAAGQVPGMMGITFPKPYTTRDATYLVIINTLKGLPNTKIDAAMGLSALTMLYLIRGGCSYCANRFHKHKKLFFFLSTLRTAFVILLYTMISWLVNMNRRDHPLFKILQSVPRGFQHAQVPILNSSLASKLVGHLPAAVIVLLIEHIAISKSFGRINNYTINPSQEMVAIGVTNVLGPFLGGFAATGSFSRTAIKSKAGVRTPFAGVITALVVLLAIYALPPVFYYIPNASLSAVIIHAVGDLITPPNTVYQFWRVSPFEVVIFFVGVIVTVFTTIENGIYCTVAISAAMLLARILKARGRFLGKVKVHSVLGDHIIGDSHRQIFGQYGDSEGLEAEIAARNVFLPIDHNDGSNPEVGLEHPYPGIFIYRFSEGFNYPNASHSLEYLTSYIFKHTRRTNLSHFPRPGDRPWNDPGPTKRELKRLQQAEEDAARRGVARDDDTPELKLPTLKAVILDFSSVNYVDVTSVQQLIDVRNQLDRYTAPEAVDWHIACINNRWAKRALLAGGFGYPAERADGGHHRWKSIFSVAEIGGADSAAAVAAEKEDEEALDLEQQATRRTTTASAGSHGKGGIAETEIGSEHSAASSDGEVGKQAIGGGAEAGVPVATTGRINNRSPRRGVTVHSFNRPLFHVDLTSAVQSAITNVEAREEVKGPASIGGVLA